MRTFEATLDPVTWTEVLAGGSSLAFDLVAAANVEVFLNESDAAPTGSGNAVKSWPDSWDFEASGFVPGVQRVWLRGNNTVRGVRG